MNWKPATRLQKLYLFNRTNTPIWKILFISKESASKLIGADIERRKPQLTRRQQEVALWEFHRHDDELPEPEIEF